MSTLLADLVRRQTSMALLNVFGRAADKVAEDLAQELLRDPALRDEMRALVRVAFTAALAELREPAPEKSGATSSDLEVAQIRIRHLQREVDVLRSKDKP